jgi:hypothetical protein
LQASLLHDDVDTVAASFHAVTGFSHQPMVQRRHVAKTVKEGDVSMTVAKHCVSRRWIVPFLKSRIHYLAARRPAMIPPFQLTPDFLPAAQKVGACEIGLKARGGLLAFREHCGRVPAHRRGKLPACAPPGVARQGQEHRLKQGILQRPLFLCSLSSFCAVQKSNFKALIQ